jgi:hypothetical protein
MPVTPLALVCLSLLLASPLRAQTAPPAAAQTAAAPTAAASAAAKKTPAHVVVIEDDSVRIEESRARGHVQRIHVQSKLGNVKGYDIQVAPPGRDPSQERGNAGQRTWSLFSF